MSVLSVTLLVGNGPDYLILHTDLPEGSWPFTGKATAKMEVAAGTGQDYCAAHFPGVPVKVINV